jgi:glutathione peroxidase
MTTDSKTPIWDIPVQSNDGKTRTLREFAGKALLIVNTASECGFTPQYAGLEKLYQQFHAKGFEVLAFPSNDFGAQVPGSDAEIKAFCELRFKTTFPLFAKIPVKGAQAHPLYLALTKTPGMEGPVKWNFAKFLIDPEGQVKARFDSSVEPDSDALRRAVETVLPAR